jgi:hypothetical protein
MLQNSCDNSKGDDSLLAKRQNKRFNFISYLVRTPFTYTFAPRTRGAQSVLFIFNISRDKTLHCSWKARALVFIFVSRAFKLASSILLTLVFIVVQHVFLFETPPSDKLAPGEKEKESKVEREEL